LRKRSGYNGELDYPGLGLKKASERRKNARNCRFSYRDPVGDTNTFSREKETEREKEEAKGNIAITTCGESTERFSLQTFRAIIKDYMRL